jgi:hypothetical protein
MKDHLEYLLSENGIQVLEPKAKNLFVYYSLNYCQGDGVCFIGVFKYKELEIHIKHIGRYTHEKSVDFYCYDIDTNENITNPEAPDNKEFIALYESICLEMKKYGYDLIEYRPSDEDFADICESNNYYFLIDGTMENINK